MAAIIITMAQVIDNNIEGQPVALIETPGNAPPIDILEIADPPKQMKAEMRMATKTPSEWLRLLCRDWSQENEEILSSMDDKFIQYKSYLKGRLTSQLLCRLSAGRESLSLSENAKTDFWAILGVQDEFDKSHIVANIERFCSLYNIRGTNPDEIAPDYGANLVTDRGVPVDGTATTANLDAKAQQIAMKNDMRRIKAEIRERDKEEYTLRKAAEKAAREQTREERRQRKIAMKKQREDYNQRQKEAALQRAAALVQSTRVPFEITRGVAKPAANQEVDNAPLPPDASVMPSSMASPDQPPPKKSRSSIIISTASDLDQIVTHSNNLWAKYNAIAKEHNQRVNWVVVAKELGIHVKVREKYARMHSRAMARGFDFKNWGHYRIKDYPQYFTDPLGPSIEATLQANALAAPQATHVDVSTFREMAQVNRPQAMDGNTNLHVMQTHDALGLAAQMAVGRMHNGRMNSDTFSDVSSAGGGEFVHGLASEQAQQTHHHANGYMTYQIPHHIHGTNSGYTNGSFSV